MVLKKIKIWIIFPFTLFFLFCLFLVFYTKFCSFKSPETQTQKGEKISLKSVVNTNEKRPMEKGPLLLVLSLEKKIIKSKKPIVFGFLEVTNLSKEPLKILSQGDFFQYLNFHFVNKETKEEFSRIPYGLNFGLLPGFSHEDIIEPGETIKRRVLPSRVIGENNISPGTYIVQAVFWYGEIVTGSNEVLLEVIP